MQAYQQLLPVPALLQSKGTLLSLQRPIVMGILNATPDSFYTRGQGSDVDSMLHAAEKMLEDGAHILDIGGASTRPGAPLVDADTELRRVLPAIEAISVRFPQVWLSVDTYNARVAAEAVAAGARMVNDVSAGHLDPAMLATVAGLGVPYIAMHMPGTPQTMQAQTTYTDVVASVRHHLQQALERCVAAGITDVVLDPGFGFGKTVERNYALLGGLHSLRILGRPLLAGISRKSMVCKPLGISPAQALNGTTALHMAALLQGAHILRVHDVHEAVETVKLYECLKGGG